MPDDPKADAEAPVAEPATEAEPAPEAADPRAVAIDAIVRAWASNHLGDSPISRDTNAWNHLQAQLPALVAALVKDL